MYLHPKTFQAYKLLHNGTLALARAEMAGMRVDMDYIERKKSLITKKIQRFEDQFKETNFYKHWQHSSKGRVNINSGNQLKHFLYNVKKIEPIKTTASGEGSTDEESLKQLNIPELNLLLERTRYKKPLDVLSGFEQEQVDGYIHPFYNLHLVRTFRSSSDSPNFQNIPKRDEEIMQLCRGALYPRPGHQLLEIDFSGLEVRIAACYHKDPNMLRYIRDPKSDMHADMAKQIFKLDQYDREKYYVLRQAAKNGFVFPEFYGDYYKNCAVIMAQGWGKLPAGKWTLHQGVELDTKMFTLSDHLIAKGINSFKAFENHVKEIEIDFWKSRFPDYADWKDRWWSTYKKYGYIDLLTGFRCSGVMGKNDCINYPVQGAAFHCLLYTFIQLDKAMISEGWDSRLIGQIHDSVIIDVNPKELKHIIETAKNIATKQLLDEWKWIIVPLDIDMEICEIDKSWAEKSKLKLEKVL